VDPFYRPTYVEISLDALRHNLQAFRAALPRDTRIMAVVKGNAYGHGAVQIAAEAVACGANYLGVALLDEALELRRAGITAPVLVLGYTPPEGIDAAIEHDVTLTAYSEDMLAALSARPAAERRLKVHVKFDTGMGRLGFTDAEEAIRYIRDLSALPAVCVEGVFTHYARADEQDKRHVALQSERFRQLIERCRTSGIEFRYAHAGNSATAIDTPELAFNMVRLGISMYGMYPSDEVDRSRVVLEPVMRFVSRVVMVKDVPAGTPIGYGGTYTAGGNERIATIPVGYADGYTRLLSGRSHVLIRGQRRPIVGRICMDQCMVNATGLDVRIGDEVVLIGSQGAERITADELAKTLGTIHYEVTSKIANRVPRVYVRNGERVGVVNPLLH
jgi:alanine racemase